MKIKSTFLYPALLFFGLCLSVKTSAQCTNDTIAPIAVCDQVININNDLDFTLQAIGLDDGSWDNCTDSVSLQYFVTTDYLQTALPTTTSIFYPAIDTFYTDTVALWVVDEAGNANSCISVLIFTGGTSNCTNDVEAPTVVCDQVVNINPDFDFTLQAIGLDDGSLDNCTDSVSLQYFVTADYLQTTVPTTTSIFYPAIDTFYTDTVALWVVDEAGNANSCISVLIFTGGTSNCTNDVEAPTMSCYNPWFITLGPTDELVITPSELDLNSTDNCTLQNDLLRFVSSGINDPNQYQSSITYPAGISGTVYPILTIRDEAGNESTCEVPITISQLDSLCNNDVLSPSIICSPDITLPYSGLDYVVVPQAVYSNAWDNCTPDSLLNFFISDQNLSAPPPPTVEVIIPEGTIGWTDIGVWVVDQAGNWAQCTRSIRVEPNPGTCDSDTIAPIAICESFLNISTIIGDEFVLEAELINDGSWDNCSSFFELEYFITQDSSLTTAPNTSVIVYPSGSNFIDTVYLWVVDEAGNESSCATIVQITPEYYFFGNVFNDENSDCIKDSLEMTIGNIPMRYTIDDGQTYNSINTTAQGYYYFGVSGNSGITEVTIELLLPNGQSSSCPTTFTTNLTNTTNAVSHDFAAKLASDCNNMTVDISTFGLRRCFPSTYFVSYCNNSTFDIDSVELIVTLPPSQVISSVGLPYTDIGNNQLLFDLGTVPSGYCDQFPIIVIQDCTTPLGATKCVQAEISPYNCDDPMQSYQGADLRVSAECDTNEEEVIFTITNVGESAMSQSKEYIVIEDVIMYMQEPIQLGLNETHEITLPANGSTWRLEIDQETDHPSLSTPSVAIEGCIEYGSMGYINQFSQPDADPFIAIDCQEVIGSFDPNDKRAFPKGYSEEHFIEKNTSIEYNIRFQNTGTDTAFTVRLEDQLDENLDWTSIATGASSHAYRMELQQGGKLIFHFENINLPDSTANELESHGFVQFRINQLPDNPLGTIIENNADIFFDFNDPILTNTVFHTIGENFILSSTIETITPDIKVLVAPNPFNQYAMISLDAKILTDVNFELYNLYGQLILREKMDGNQYRLLRSDLSAGTFIFRITNDNKMLASGKLIIQ